MGHEPNTIKEHTLLAFTSGLHCCPNSDTDKFSNWVVNEVESSPYKLDTVKKNCRLQPVNNKLHIYFQTLIVSYPTKYIQKQLCQIKNTNSHINKTHYTQCRFTRLA